MNVYDNANELAKAMRESHEFKKLKEATAVLNKDENAKKMVNEFLSLNQQAEMEKYQGKEPSKETTEKIQKLYGILSLNHAIFELLHAFSNDAGRRNQLYSRRS